MRTGLGLFSAAVMSVLRAPAVALRILLLPGLLRLALEIWAERVAANPEAGWVALILAIADAAFVGAVAVSWHRYTLLQEQPSLLFRGARPRRFAAYAIEWLILGILLFLLVLPVLLIEAFLLPAGTFLTLGADLIEYFPGAAVLIAVVAVWLFTWAFFRLAMGLPELALNDKRNGRTASWRQTGALEPAIAICALLAAGAMLLMWSPSFLGMYVFPEEWVFAEIPPEDDYFTPIRLSFGYLLSVQLVWSLTVLFGAAMLSEIYRRLTRPEGE